MKLSEYLDEAKLAEHVNRGLVTVRHHNTLPLSIYSYSRKAMYSNHWDDITTKTRGLIVDKEGNIVARPYEKFFAVGQHPSTDPLTIRDMDANFGPPVITEKINGCLGIFWKYGVHWGVATKGSFHSPHAEWATKWLEDHIEHNGRLIFPEGYTPVFEIICQDVQPHVIKYPKDRLVLLGFVNNQSGEELEYGWDDGVAAYAYRNHLFATPKVTIDVQDAMQSDSDKFEGYVATYNIPGQVPYKLKIKFPTFIKNRRKFYADRLAGRELTEEELEELAQAKITQSKAKTIVTEALVKFTTRKEFAEYFNLPENKEYASECFRLLDYDGGK